MIIRPTEVHEDLDVARFGVIMASELLAIKCNCTLASQWRIDIDSRERTAFLALARAEGLRVRGRTSGWRT